MTMVRSPLIAASIERSDRSRSTNNGVTACGYSTASRTGRMGTTVVRSSTSTILDTLRANQLHVTFFLTGQWVQSYPDMARQVAADGHELANHTYYHPDLTQLSASQITWELDYSNGIIESTLGRTSKPWFRP